MADTIPTGRALPGSPFVQGLIWMGLSMVAFIAMSVGWREMAGTLTAAAGYGPSLIMVKLPLGLIAALTDWRPVPMAAVVSFLRL